MAPLPDISTDPFLSWFAQSEVKDGSGAPLVCYHAGDGAVATFKPFTHFGTLLAAQRRAADKRIAKPTIHEVYLALANPLEVVDDEVDNNPLRLLDLAVERRILSADDRGKLLAGVADAMGKAIANARSPAEHVEFKWKAGMNMLSPRLATYNFDGLKYDNTLESGISFVNFRSDQVWQVGKPSHD
jgi:hypothetical protein